MSDAGILERRSGPEAGDQEERHGIPPGVDRQLQESHQRMDAHVLGYGQGPSIPDQQISLVPASICSLSQDCLER